MMKRSRQSPWEKEKSEFLSLNRAEKAARLIYLLLLLLLSTQLGKHFWPSYTLVSGFRVDYLSPTLYVTDILIMLLFLMMFLNERKLFIQALIKYRLLLLLLTLFLGSTALLSAAPAAGFYTLLKLMEFSFFAWYTTRFLMRKNSIRLVVRMVFFGVLFQSALALLQVVSHGSIGGILYLLGERSISTLTPGAATAVINGVVYLRPYATFSHPNVLAGFLLLSMTFLLFQRHTFSFRFGQSLSLFGLFLGTAGLLASLSRVPIVLWGIVLLVIIVSAGVMRRKQKLQRPDLLRMGLVPVLGLVLLSPLLSPVLIRTLHSSVTEESFVVRGDLLAIAGKVITTAPIFGVGPGNYLITASSYRESHLPLFLSVQPVHNILLLLWAEVGLIGLVLFLVFLLFTFRTGSLPARVLLVLLLLLGLVDHYFLTIQQGQLLLAFVIGYCWAGKTPAIKKPRHYEKQAISG